MHNKYTSVWVLEKERKKEQKGKYREKRKETERKRTMRAGHNKETVLGENLTQGTEGNSLWVLNTLEWLKKCNKVKFNRLNAKNTELAENEDCRIN